MLQRKRHHGNTTVLNRHDQAAHLGRRISCAVQLFKRVTIISFRRVFDVLHPFLSVVYVVHILRTVVLEVGVVMCWFKRSAWC